MRRNTSSIQGESFEDYLTRHAPGLFGDYAKFRAAFRSRGTEMIQRKYGTLAKALAALGWTQEWLNCYELKPQDLIGAFGRADFFFTPKLANCYGLTPDYWLQRRAESEKEDWDWEFGSWVWVGQFFYRQMPLWKRLLNRLVHVGFGREPGPST
jgi:hypothetical protein